MRRGAISEAQAQTQNRNRHAVETDFFDELQAANRRISRIILTAALKSAEPLSTRRRFLADRP
jgi:hypothetical protein